MKQNAAEAAVLAFNAYINARDLDGIAGLMAADHVFVDAAGGKITGKDECRKAWASFFAAFPDYRNELDELRERNGVIVARGRSRCADHRLDGPAFWSAIIVEGRLREWRVYIDNAENRRALGFDPAPSA